MKFSEFFNTPNDRDIAERLKAATQIKLDDSSRTQMRGFLSEYARMRPIRSNRAQEKPNKRFFAFLAAHIHPMPMIAAVLIIAVSSGTVAASETSLPGDLLYPIKVHVSEEVRTSLTISPKARADWELSRAERRLEEAAILALDGSLDDILRSEIDTNLDAHIAHAGEDRLKLEERNDASSASTIDVNIEAIRFARENILGRQRPTFAAARVAAKDAEKTATMSMAAEAPQESANATAQPEASLRMAADVPQESTTAATQLAESADNLEARSKGNRAAAKARIEATKKFLNRNNKRLRPEASMQIQEQLKAATNALSSGEESVERGDDTEASDNFDRALQAIIETQDFVSENIKDDYSDKNKGRGEDSGDQDEPNREED